MWRTIVSRRTLISPAAIILLLAATLGSYLILSHAGAAPQPYVAIPGSAPNLPPSVQLQGQHNTSAPLTITIALRPNNEAQLNALLVALYDPNSPQYQKWLGTGQFNARFAPSAAQIAQVQSFLKQSGLRVVNSPTPFLVRAVGTTAQVEAAFHIHLKDYKTANGKTFFQNDGAVHVPANLGKMVLGVTGLTNTVNLHPSYFLPRHAKNGAGAAAPQYGAAPGGSGLTPSQDISLYGGTGIQRLGNRGKGAGANLAVFELSGYTPADVVTYEHQFFGPSENIPIVNINVDGGPVNPVCPAGDVCGPVDPSDPTHCPPPLFGCNSADFSGDIEVEADIETQLAIAPKISHIIVYNAPNDFFGITTLDEYFTIANDNLADSISSSWGLCEQDAGFAQAQAENIAFMQMAAQGQSIFNSSGDTGAFGCLRGSGATDLSVGDPAAQPFVTGVGGTSWSSFDPQNTPHPAYPNGFETVWNELNSCDGSAFGLGQCTQFGAGGGGVSRFWAQPSYQHGPGVISPFSQKSPFCSQATAGQFCREVPDISANADEFTPYAEFCTGDPKTNSTCALFSSAQPAPGWFGIGGTSLSSPLISAVIALWDSVHGHRFGNANFGLYKLFRSNNAYSRFFHDITGVHQTENFNGFYPVTPKFDMSTGIGTPRIDGIVLSHP